MDVLSPVYTWVTMYISELLVHSHILKIYFYFLFMCMCVCVCDRMPLVWVRRYPGGQKMALDPLELKFQVVVRSLM